MCCVWCMWSHCSASEFHHTQTVTVTGSCSYHSAGWNMWMFTADWCRTEMYARISLIIIIIVIIKTRICAAEMAVRYATLSACRKVRMPSVHAEKYGCRQCVPKSTSVMLAVDEKTLPIATITGRTDRQTDRRTECDAICGPLLGRRAA